MAEQRFIPEDEVVDPDKVVLPDCLNCGNWVCDCPTNYEEYTERVKLRRESW